MTYILLIHTRAHTRNARAHAHDLIKRRHQSSHNKLNYFLLLTKLVCVSSCTSSPSFSGDKPHEKSAQLVTPTTNCTRLLLGCLYRSKGAGLIRIVDGLLIALQRRAPCSDRTHTISLEGHVRYGSSSSAFGRLTAKSTSV